MKINILKVFFLPCLFLVICDASYSEGYLWNEVSLSNAANYWKRFWEVKYLTPGSVNSVYLPLTGKIPFLKLLYILLFVLTAGMVILFRPINVTSFIKSFTLSCVVVGTLFAIRMDYNWYRHWRDRAVLSHRSLDERISLLGNGNAYYLADSLKKIIYPGEKVRVYIGEKSADIGFMRQLKYYLLPVKVSDMGRYILVFKDDNISFDPSGNRLFKNNEAIARDVVLVSNIDRDIILYKITR
jgi:hypothetical protein